MWCMRGGWQGTSSGRLTRIRSHRLRRPRWFKEGKYKIRVSLFFVMVVISGVLAWEV